MLRRHGAEGSAYSPGSKVSPVSRSNQSSRYSSHSRIRRPGFEEVPQLYIDPVECIDCGACVPVCPVSAIFALDDLPEKWKHYAELNASYVEGGKFKQEEYTKHQAAK